MQNIIAIENGVTRHPLYRMKEPVNMTLAAGEHIAVVGRIFFFLQIEIH